MPLCLSEMCSVAPLGVQTASPVPRPWSKEARERVYFYHSNGIVMHYTESRWAHQKEQEAIAGEARVNETFRRLVRDGMTFNELGLDLKNHKAALERLACYLLPTTKYYLLTNYLLTYLLARLLHKAVLKRLKAQGMWDAVAAERVSSL